MSYALVFAPDAKLDWLQLDVALQEHVLDELDAWLDGGHAVPDDDSVFRHNVTVPSAGGFRHLSIGLSFDANAGSLLVLGIYVL